MLTHEEGDACASRCPEYQACVPPNKPLKLTAARCARMTLDLAAKLPDVQVINLGGGFKVGRMPGEPSVDLTDVGAHVRQELLAFRERDGRTLSLEIEPGTYLVANAGDL